MAQRFLIIFCTTASEQEAAVLGRTLVEEGLAACANIIPQIRSIYRWKEKIWDEGEFLLLIKTRIALFGQVEDKIKEIHTYEVPEIIGIPIAQGFGTYLNWLRESTLS